MADTLVDADVDVLNDLDTDWAEECYSEDCENRAEWEARCRACGLGVLACTECVRIASEEYQEVICVRCKAAGPFDDVIMLAPWPGGLS